MIYQDDDDDHLATTKLMRKHDCARMAIIRVGATDFDDRKVYALHVLPESIADSPSIAWGLGCLATYLIERRSDSFVRHAAALYHAFRDQGVRLLQCFIADALFDRWDRVCDGNEFARDLLHERLVVFKKRKARGERGSGVVPVVQKVQAA